MPNNPRLSKGNRSQAAARSTRSSQIAKSRAISKKIGEREFKNGALAGLAISLLTSKAPAPTPPAQAVVPPTVDIDYQHLAKEITRQLWGEDPPGTLMGIRQIIRQQRADRDLDQETRQFLVETSNKLDRVLELFDED